MAADLAERVVLVTGAAGDLGRAACAALAAAGARVVALDRDGGALARVRDAGAAWAWPVDVTDEEAVEAAFARARREAGRLDGVFNNAGVEGRPAPIADTPLAALDEVLDVNVRGAFLVLRAALRALGAGGAVVNTASGAALVGSPGLGPYVASKHAVLGLTRTAALEAAPRGVRVNAICPGPVEGRMMRAIEHGLDPDAAPGSFAPAVPLGRYATPAEIAATVVFLLSPAAAYVTGAAVAVDGGLTAA